MLDLLFILDIMKKLLLATFTLLFCMNLITASPKNDWERKKLLGKVKSVEWVSYSATEENGEVIRGGRLDYHHLLFNKEGMITTETQETLRSAISDGRKDYTYDDKGNKIEEKHYSLKNVLISEVKMAYDGNGNMTEYRFTEIKQDDSTRPLLITVQYKYNEKGDCIESIDLDNGELSSGRIYTYDDKGSVVKWQQYNAEKEYQSWGILKYDDNNNLIEDIAYNSDGKEDTYETHKYDDKNRRIETNRYYDGKLLVTEQFEYDDKDNHIGYIRIHDGEKFSGKNIVEYDDQGNWTRRTIYVDGRPDYIDMQTIEYY